MDENDAVRDAPPTFLSEPIEAYLAPLIEDLALYEARARIPVTLSAALGERYLVQRELGQGGMATVYLAVDNQVGSPVAVKVLAHPLAGSLSAERFVRESEITIALRHERIVPVHDRGAADGLLYYVMRYFPGGSLRERLARDGPLPIATAIAMARDVAAALDFAHCCGIVHRDIKPENILLDGDNAFVADFGVARLIDAAGRDRLTESGAVLGTAQYMSPEQAGSEKTIDARSDIYSLGCVVFEMLAGDPPFTSSSAKTILARQMHERPPRLSIVRPTVTLELEAAVERALAKQRADRFHSASAFVEALAGAASGATARSRRMRRYLTTATAVGLLAAATTWLVRNNGLAREAQPDLLRQIAVLYFDDLTPDGRLSHVAAGLTEDLIDELSQVRGLRVISSNGVRVARDSSFSPRQLAERFGIGTLITGSIASSPSLVRLTVRLVDARSETQVAGDDWERPAWDLLTLQDSLTTEVGLWLRERLGARLRPIEQRRATQSAEAWELVQMGEALRQEGAALTRRADPGAREVLLRADSVLSLAEQRDDGWVAAAVTRGRVDMALAFAERDDRLPRERDSTFLNGFRRAIARVDRALERNRDSPEALAVRGEARLRLAMFGVLGDRAAHLVRAEEDLRRAVTARPDFAEAWSMLGGVYYRQARYEEAADAQQTAYETDAFLTDIRALMSDLFASSLYAERFEDARKWCGMGRARHPEDPRFVECELTLLGAIGRTRADAATAWQTLDGIESADSTGRFAATWTFRRMMVAAVLARAGLSDSARAVVERTEGERGGRPAARWAEARVRVLLDDRADALRLLRDEIAADPHQRGWVSRMPWFRSLRDDSTFRELVRDPPPAVSDSGPP